MNDLKKLKNYRCLVTMMLASSLLAACATQPQKPITLAKAVSTEQLGLTHQVTAPISATWWTQLNDSTLNGLIEHAMQQSPDLMAVSSRLAQAQAGSDLADSQRGMQIAIAANGAGIYHESLSHPDSLASQIFGDTIGYKAVQLKGKWTWDLWGEHKSELEVALGKQNATAYELAQARLLLAQAITAQYMQLQILTAQKAILQQRIGIKKEQEQLVLDRAKAGLLPANQRYPIQQAILQMQVGIQDLDNKANQIRNALANLTAQSPTALANLTPQPIKTLPSLPTQQLTANLIGQRADIAAQREAIYSRQQLIHAAETKFYPNIQINALAGLSTLQIGELPSSSNLLSAILPTVTLPIFTSGALQANLQQKQAEYNEQIARYNKSVYQALKEAADALSNYQTAVKMQQSQQQMLVVAQKNQRAIQNRIQAGLETQITLLTARDEMLQSQSQLLQSQLQERVGWVALNVALGGGVNLAK
ncbi:MULTISPECIES: efflux transporter outer membrane subunit [unclassified Acinetobacter]|uniref:efflux transporter outer membrane subunit n=1 Tax=unclassified Acinetobacter TaxID=196816 RepID=UPI0035BA658F